MKKINLLLIPVAAATMLFSGCKEDPLTNDDPDAKVVVTAKQSDVVDAAAAMYAAWEAEPVIPEKMTVAGTELTAPQYQYAMAKLLVDLGAGSTADIDVLNYKAAAYPERDNYDKDVIAVKNGPANGENTEDLLNVAQRMLDAMAEKGTVPNQTLFEREGESIAFSTNRATVTFARAIADYKKNGSLPATVATDYLSTAANLKGFASQVVQYMRKWEETVGTVSADGSHNSGRIPPNPWENAHFIPIPWHEKCAVAADGEDQYNIQYLPYLEIEVAGVKYNAAQALGVSMAALLDLLTVEGSSLAQTVINEKVHTPGNGVDMTAPIPAISEGYAWGPHPWYENEDEEGPLMYNGEPAETVGIDFILTVAPWFLKRCTADDLGRYPNYFTFAEGSLELEGYTGYACPMRVFVIALRFWDYIVNNNITENVYDALKDVKVEANLYGSEQPPLAIDTENATIPVEGGEVKVKVNAKDDSWTATVDGDFVTVDPMSGNAGETEVTVTVAENAGAARSAKVTFTTAGGSVKVFSITQDSAPNFASIADFIEQAVTYLDVYDATVGSVYADGDHKGEKNGWHDAHFIPIPWHKNCSVAADGEAQYDAKYQPYHTITVGGQELNAAQTAGVAIATLVDLLTAEGSTVFQEVINTKIHTPANGKKLSDPMPEVLASYAWGPHPWYESPVLTYNGEAVGDVGLDFFLTYGPWFIYKSTTTGKSDTPTGRYPNYFTFETGSLELEGYEGLASPMRLFLIALRYLDYIHENNITENVYDALKDVKVSADLYNQGAKAATIADFAKEAVTYLDVWENTVGDVASDGTHSMKSQPANPWTNVHFIPIPWHANCSVAVDGEAQYDAKYQPCHTITVGDKTLNAAQTCGVAIASLVDLLTAEGSLVLQEELGVVTHTLANGKTTADLMPEVLQNYAWGPHPWYEALTDDEPGPIKYNGADVTEVGLDFFLSYGPWFLKKSTITGVNDTYPKGRYPNYFTYADDGLVCEGYEGYASPMRLFLISLRFLDYIVENNITENVYDALKDVKVSAVLY